jgi:hypothetical protein
MQENVIVDFPEFRLRRLRWTVGPRGNQNEGCGRRSAGRANKLAFGCVHETTPDWRLLAAVDLTRQWALERQFLSD